MDISTKLTLESEMGRTRRDSMISHYQKPDRAYQSTDEGLFTRMVLVIQQYAWAK
jgi:hypothetical protein